MHTRHSVTVINGHRSASRWCTCAACSWRRRNYVTMTMYRPQLRTAVHTTDCYAEHTAHPIVPPHERLRLTKSALCETFQEEASLALLGKLASQYSELVMFTHSAGKIISPRMSQRLRVLATRANIVHEHLDVQSPTQIIDIIQAAFPAISTPLFHANEAAVRSIFALAPLFIQSSSVTCSHAQCFLLHWLLAGGSCTPGPEAVYMQVSLWVRRSVRLCCRAREDVRTISCISRWARA
jgi:hypothetical protein